MNLRLYLARCLLYCLPALLLAACMTSDEPPRVLVFTKAEGFRHGSIEAGIAALQVAGARAGYAVDTTAHAGAFTEPNLQRYRAVVFLNTSGDVLDYSQQADFERFVQAGGGFVGIHAAADTERDWPWYGRLVGLSPEAPAEAAGILPATLTVLDPQHPATDSLPARLALADAWYRYQVDGAVHPLVAFEADSARQPVAWAHAHDGGRAFYLAAGHTPAVFADTTIQRMLRGALRYAVGEAPLDYRKARTKRVPEANRFTKTVLADHLNEPAELVLLGEGRVLFVERKGAVRLYDPAGGLRTIAQLDVSTTFADGSDAEDGLLGVTLDPGFAENRWVYFYFSPAGAEPKQQLVRYQLDGDSLVAASRRVVLEVPTQRDECCHTGGSMAWDAAGNLYLSTGDNTNPFESDGYAPIDERPGRTPFDAQRAPANTNDLRGKILRIHPEADGSYTIPEGNLFVDDDPRTRPEIYVMGNRNPYRISLDRRTGYLYWGEIGPDAGEDDPLRGPRGYDEINQARGPGFFGWPYFIGDNQPYRAYDFATGTHGPAYDPARPVNDSPNNTGLRTLPPAQPAFIWYPYAHSPEFPIVGAGGRTAMAGPVFYADDYTPVEHAFPDYYDGKLLIYEWMRDWILAATLDAEGNLERLEPVVPNLAFSNPVDMAFDEHGVLYVLEYGESWFAQNPDARLSRVEYNPGNRRPVVAASADRTMGAAPLQVRLSAEGTRDDDGDALTYAWTLDGRTLSSAPAFTHTFEAPGTYRPTLTVTDAAGHAVSAGVDVVVGNEPPHVRFEIAGNRSFYWEGRRFTYRAEATDAEDEQAAGIDGDGLYVQFDYLEEGYDRVQIEQGHRSSAGPQTGFARGQQLIAGSDCAACHSETARSIGPSFREVAVRYQDQPEAADYLATKIIEGGGGVWGEQAMAAHPQLSEAEAAAMVSYILSLAAERAPGLPAAGTYATTAHETTGTEGTYILRAAYTDQGAHGVGPLTTEEVVALRHPRLQAEAYDAGRHVGRQVGDGQTPTYVKNIYDGSYLVFRDIDLEEVRALTYRVRTEALHDAGGRVELHLDAPDGPLVSTAEVAPGAAAEEQEVTAAVAETSGVHDLYFVFKHPAPQGNALFLLDWIYFHTR